MIGAADSAEVSVGAGQSSPSFGWTMEGKGRHADALFTALVLDEGLTVVVQDSRAIGRGEQSLPGDLGEQKLLAVNPRFRSAVLTRQRLCALVQINESSAFAEVAGDSEEVCREWIEEIFAALPQPDQFEASTAITFWSGRKEGDGQPHHRRIDVSPWQGAEAGAVPVGITVWRGNSRATGPLRVSTRSPMRWRFRSLRRASSCSAIRSSCHR